MENCQHGNFAPVDTLQLMPVSQAGMERHKCVICAYQGGFRIGIQGVFTGIPVFEIACKHGKTAPEYYLRELPESQAGTGRHKCAVCAFYDGLVAGMQVGKEGVVLEKKAPATPKGLRQVEMPAQGVNPFEGIKRKFAPKKDVDYPKIHAERTSIGLLGEKLVVEHEKYWLTDRGLAELAAKVEHTSVIKGDGVGYDILSFDADGNPKYIEVKTTTGSLDTIFYMSANEVDFSKLNSGSYYLYRVFNFSEKEPSGEFYVFQGDVTTMFFFNPYVYQVAR